MARADLATPFMQGLQIGSNLMVNLKKIREDERKRESDAQIEQMKQQTELLKTGMDQQKKVADVALQFVSNEKILANQSKVDTFNKSILPFINSFAPKDALIQPLTEWNSESANLAKAMQEVNNLPDDVPQEVRSQALAEHLAAYGLGEQALKQSQEALKPLSAAQQELATLTPDEIRKRALQGTEFKPEVRTGVKIDDKGTEAMVQRRADGGWDIVKVGGKELKGRTPRGEGKATEGERKAAVLATRLEGAVKVLSSLPAAAGKPGMAERAFQTIGAESLANFSRSSDRQRANAAQLDALDAALTLATGAAYTKEQFQNAQVSLFPQLNDTKDSAAEKNRRLTMIVEAARLAAGNAAYTIDDAVKKIIEESVGGRPPLSNFEG